MKKLLVEFPDERYEEMQKLMRDCGIENTLDLFNNALTLLEFAINEEKLGNRIAIVEKSKSHIDYIRMPLFDDIRKELNHKPEEPKNKKSDHLKVIK